VFDRMAAHDRQDYMQAAQRYSPKADLPCVHSQRNRSDTEIRKRI
jgi:hypothetical protein